MRDEPLLLEAVPETKSSPGSVYLDEVEVFFFFFAAARKSSPIALDFVDEAASKTNSSAISSLSPWEDFPDFAEARLFALEADVLPLLLLLLLALLLAETVLFAFVAFGFAAAFFVFGPPRDSSAWCLPHHLLPLYAQ